MKRLLTLMVVVFATSALWAYDFKEGDLYYDILDTQGKEVAVTYERYWGSSNYVGLTSVTIPSTVTHEGTIYAVTHIGSQAFSFCTGLTSVTIPNSVTSIGSAAFSSCKGLTSITIPSRVTSIGDHAFSSSTGLTSITIPNSVTSIGYNAFSFCTGLTSIVVEVGNTAYDSRENCNAIIRTSTNTLIHGCKTTIIPNSVTSIGSHAFDGRTGLTSITIPNSVTSIGEGAFWCCTGLTSITIPNRVKSIGNYAFYECTGLTSVTIGNSVTSIGGSAFSECTGLASITIPNSVTSIEEGAFFRVLNIIYGGNATGSPWGARSVNGYVEGYLVYADATKTTLLGCSSAAIGAISIPNTVTSIGSSAFYRCTGLTSITIPNSVTSIGSNAFYNVLNVIYTGTATGSPWGARYVNGYVDGYWVYEDATKTKIVACSTAAPDGTIIPSGVTSIGDGAFTNCTLLKSITIPEGITSIGNNAFKGCSNLTSVVWNAKKCDGWSRYSAAPFYNIQDNIQSFVFGNTVESIPDYLCYDMDYLTTVTIPNSVTSIGKEAFYFCSRLKYVCMQSSTPPSCYSSSFYSSSIIIVPEEAVTTYRNHTAWKNYTISCYGLGQFKEATTTQTTMNISWTICGKNKSGINGFQYSTDNNYASDATHTVYLNVATDSVIQIDTLITGLVPNTTYYLHSFIQTFDGQMIYSGTSTKKTQEIQLSISNTSRTQKTIAARFQYDWGDAENIVKYGYTVVGTPFTDTILATGVITEPVKIDTLVMGLIPNTEYTFRTFVERQDSVPMDSVALEENFSKGMDDWETYITHNDDYGSWQHYNSGECALSSAEYVTGWLIHAITLTAGVEYTLCTLVRDYFVGAGTGGMAIGIGNSNNPSSMTTIVSKESLSSEYEKITGTFIPTESGIYYVGLYASVSPIYRMGYVYFKELSVSAPYSQPRKKAITISTNNEQKFTTLPVSASISCNKRTQTTLAVRGSYDCGDATNTGKNGIQYCEGASFGNEYKTIAINRTDSAARLDTTITGLKHYTQYSVRTYVETAEGNMAYSSVKTYRTRDVDMTFQSTQSTQTKATFHTTYNVGDLPLVINSGIQYCVGSSFSADEAQTFYFNRTDSALVLDTIVTGLTPNTKYTFRAFVETQDEKIYSTTRRVTTLPVTISEPTLTQYGQTYMLLATSSNYGDATLVEEAVEYGTSKSADDIQKASVSNSMVKINNLLPDTRYYYRSLLTTTEGGTIYSDWQEMTTKVITLSMGEADGISAKSVFLHGTIDCDMESRTEIGFEWKRSDAPATVKPQRVLVTDRVDSNLVFRLEGLGKDKYYDYRAYCLYKEQTYYGKAEDGREWVTFLTAEEDVLVAPSVQTLGAEVSETGVELKGFVVAGTENIIQQGFESWRAGTTDVATTVSTGSVMTNTIPEPWSYTTYQYRAYAKTPSGTTYGETKEVTTDYIHTDIADVVVTPSATTASVTWTVVEQANYYELTLFGTAEMTDTIATYTVDTDGTITHRRAPSTLQALVNCNIDQLTPETAYFFTVIAYNADEKKVAEENGSFTTTKPTTGIDTVSHTDTDTDNGITVRKVLIDGKVYILRGDKVYTLTGVEVEELGIRN